jgi:hypothetical protein
MSGIARAGLSANELLAPQEFWQKQQQVNAYTQGVGLQAQHQERELEDHDQAQIANVAGYLLSHDALPISRNRILTPTPQAARVSAVLCRSTPGRRPRPASACSRSTRRR